VARAAHREETEKIMSRKAPKLMELPANKLAMPVSRHGVSDARPGEICAQKLGMRATVFPVRE